MAPICGSFSAFKLEYMDNSAGMSAIPGKLYSCGGILLSFVLNFAVYKYAVACS